MKKSKVMIVTFVAPALLFFVTTFVYPIIRTILMSFFQIDNVTAPMAQWSFAGVSNYTKLFGTEVFKTSLLNLLKIWFFGGIIVMFLALLFAVILTSGIRGKKFFRAVIYMPNIVSAVALAVMWQQFVFNNNYGLFNPIAKALGFAWLDPDHIFLAMLIAYCFGMVGYHMLIFLSGIERIDASYFEAARIDGANVFTQFFYVTLPLLKGVFKTNITMWSITSVAFFVWSQLFSSVTPSGALMTPMVYLYAQTFGSGNTVTERNAGLGAAIGIILAICVLVIFTVCNKLLKDDDLEF
jgi:ABC-type sugar transport system permease subunit